MVHRESDSMTKRASVTAGKVTPCWTAVGLRLWIDPTPLTAEIQVQIGRSTMRLRLIIKTIMIRVQ